VELTLQAMKTLSELMDKALDLDATSRTQWLAELATGPHASLQPLLADMLAQQANMETAFLVKPISLTTLADPAASGSETATPALVAGTRIGPYVLEREIGVGGMGAVWLAARDDGALKRRVALKLPMLHRTQSLAERFSRERDILASLTHPNVARLYDAGVTASGQPYLALEYVEGKPITVHCDAIGLLVEERLRRFLQVAAAVQYAHANLVIHRDLKPSNILVSEDGQVHLLDFGIAKLLDDPKGQAAETELTMLAGRALTLDYASPEQVSGQAISTASDVYSMGVVLYQLLTGERPYQLKRGSRAELEEAILSIEPQLVSDAVRRGDESLAIKRGVGRGKLAKTLAGDLDTIVAKAMKKAPQERYATVAAFAEDIQRHLDGLPVEAQPDSWRYRAGKFVARHRGGVAAGLAVVAALASGLAIAVWQASVATGEAARADREADLARGEKSRADSEAASARQQSTRADKEAGAALVAAKHAQDQAERADQSSAQAKVAAAQARAAAVLAEQQAAAAQRETQRATAVQGFLTDLFNTNSNDQRNAIQVRTLNAKQLLDRGAGRLEAASSGDLVVDAMLLNLFGNLYENLGDYQTSKRFHEKSINVAEKTHGKQSREYANAILDLAWVESYEVAGKRLDLIEEAEAILRKAAPDGPQLGRALTIKARNIDRAQPAKKLAAAREAVQVLSKHKKETKLWAAAETALALAERESGNYEEGLKALQRSVNLFTQLSGADSLEAGQALGGAGMTQRQLLRSKDAERSLAQAVEILRPYHRDPIDATTFGRGWHLVRAGMGEAESAQRAMEAAYKKLVDADGKTHPLKAGVSSTLSTIAQLRGDTRTSLELAQRALQERGTRSPNLVAADSLTIANNAIGAREVKIAEDALQVAQKIQDEKGLPLLTQRTLERVKASLAALKGNAGVAVMPDDSAASAPEEEGGTPFSRLQASLARAKLSARKGDWNEVKASCSPWLINTGQYELPNYLRGELLMLAAEAEHRTSGGGARAMLDEATLIFSKHDVPHSKRLARLQTLSDMFAAK
jgi:serine/threonine protein kinase/tetratricopeptide (TPR) repeat protein